MAFRVGLLVAFVAIFGVAVASGVLFLANDGRPDPTMTPTTSRPPATPTIHIFPPPPTVIVERPTPLPGTPTPFGRIPVGTTVIVRASFTAKSVLLVSTYETAQSL